MNEKRHPMLLTRAAALLAEEHPEIAFSAVQLRDMCSRRTIPCMEVPTCGMTRKYRHMVHYPTLVKFLKGCIQPVIQ
jgi:hypothetical protein